MERNYEVVKLISSWGSTIDVTGIYVALKKSLKLGERNDQPKIAPSRIKTDDNKVHLIFTTYFERNDKDKYMVQRDQISRIYNKIFDIPGIAFLRHSEIMWYMGRIYVDYPHITLSKAEETILNRQMEISLVTVISIIQVFYDNEPLEDIDLLNRVLHWVYTGA